MISEPVKSFSFEKGMEEFHAGNIVRIATMGITVLHLFLYKVIGRNELIRRTGGSTKAIEFKLQKDMVEGI